jgi:peptidyl-prolyl cis-trans isomerase SurA
MRTRRRCKALTALVKDTPDARIEELKFLRPSALPEPTRSLMLAAKDGELLPPAATGTAIEVYAVCGRRAMKVDDQKREKATNELKSQEFELLARRRLLDLRQEAHIEYR